MKKQNTILKNISEDELKIIEKIIKITDSLFIKPSVNKKGIYSELIRTFKSFSIAISCLIILIILAIINIFKPSFMGHYTRLIINIIEICIYLNIIYIFCKNLYKEIKTVYDYIKITPKKLAKNYQEKIVRIEEILNEISILPDKLLIKLQLIIECMIERYEYLYKRGQLICSIVFIFFITLIFKISSILEDFFNIKALQHLLENNKSYLCYITIFLFSLYIGLLYLNEILFNKKQLLFLLKALKEYRKINN